MPLKLPPLGSLRAFEAAARHQSFKRAAEELNLTPSAVSHGIQTLEEWLGADLFHRGARGLSMTTAGNAYAQSVGQALRLIGEATFEIAGRRSTGALSISSAPTFASRLLIPRLSSFTQRHPDIRISIDSSHLRVEFPSNTVDLAVRLSDSASGSGIWIPLIEERFVPVCSPSMPRAGVSNPLSVLTSAPLIQVTSVSRGWPEWFRAAGLGALQLNQVLKVDTINMALEAAKKGLGIALGPLPLVESELDQGDLVQACGPVVPSGITYWLVGAEPTFDRPEAKLFRNWLIAELKSAEDAAQSNGAGTRKKATAA
jgi:LysR family glycine cleavage system transcriptional activator